MKYFAIIVAGIAMSAAAFAQDGAVIALGGAAQSPHALFRQGCQAAIFEAQVCAISGSFSDGDQCWAGYEGCAQGSWVSATDYAAVEAFVQSLEAQYAATGTCSYHEGTVAPQPPSPEPTPTPTVTPEPKPTPTPTATVQPSEPPGKPVP